MIDIMVKIVLDYYVRLGKAIASLYYLDVEHLCASCKDTGKYYAKLLFFYVYLLADTEEDLDLVIKQIIRIACVFIAIVPELRELRDYVGIKPVIA
jgi:hypothetical protein